MRFSLATLVLLVLWIGALIAVWMRWDPWDFEREVSNVPYVDRGGSATAPDGVRVAMYDFGWQSTYVARWEEHNIIQRLSTDFEYGSAGPQIPIRFVDNDTLELWRSNPATPGEGFIATYRRRFPEWWWGHFYRPEVWLAVALSGLLIWRAVKSRQSGKVGAWRLIAQATAM